MRIIEGIPYNSKESEDTPMLFFLDSSSIEHIYMSYMMSHALAAQPLACWSRRRPCESCRSMASTSAKQRSALRTRPMQVASFSLSIAPRSCHMLHQIICRYADIMHIMYTL